MNMDPQPKKKRGQWTEENLKKALSEIANKRLSQRQAEKIYKIPRRTLRNYLKQECNIKKAVKKCVLTKDQERGLVSRIKRFADIGIPLTPKRIRQQAYIFCEKNGITNNFNHNKRCAGKNWLKQFLTRNPDITKRKAQFMNPARAQKLNKTIVHRHFQSIKEIYLELDITNHPERVYNIDEKGCRLTLHHQQVVLAEKGTKRVHLIAPEHAENVTIAMCVNATGNAIPPMIIFKGKRMKPEFNDNLPAGSLVRMATKGSMTTELFIEFLDHFSKFKSPGRCLLIFDGASSHLDYRIAEKADEHNIVLYCLPSNTTHELQPLDKSVNKSYEHHWDQELLLYNYQNPNNKLTKSRFNKNFSKVWLKCMTQENIINGFRATGLYPWDPSAIPEEAYAPSILTERPVPPQDQAQCNSNASNRNSGSVSQVIVNATDFDRTTTPLGNQDSSDSDVTFYEDDDQITKEIHPSIQESPENPRDRLPIHHNSNKLSTNAPDLNPIKLVDYSSSESEAPEREQNECNEPVRYSTPIPSTSYPQRLPCNIVHHSSSSGSDFDDYDYNIQQLYQTKARSIKIYSSTSESDEDHENRAFTVTTRKTKEVYVSEDEQPLSKIKQSATITAVSLTPFQDLLPTPNYATTKNKPRRKALNYIGQRVTKDLFKEKQNKKENTHLEKDSKQTKKQNKSTLNIKEQDRITKNKNVKTIKRLTKTKAKPGKKIQQPGKQQMIATKKIIKDRQAPENWYCNACKTERVDDMRLCIICHQWYHEDCVGLTRDDLEEFVCPNCG